jgi:hypothetical protein
LLKIGRNETIELSMRTSALAAAAPFFAPKYGPLSPPRFITGSPDLGRLTDAQSAVSFTANVVEQVRSGQMDVDDGRFFLGAAELFAKLHERVALEAEVERRRELESAEP